MPAEATIYLDRLGASPEVRIMTTESGHRCIRLDLHGVVLFLPGFNGAASSYANQLAGRLIAAATTIDDAQLGQGVTCDDRR